MIIDPSAEIVIWLFCVGICWERAVVWGSRDLIQWNGMKLEKQEGSSELWQKELARNSKACAIIQPWDVPGSPVAKALNFPKQAASFDP